LIYINWPSALANMWENGVRSLWVIACARCPVVNAHPG
jgi:hypothetical protein